MPGVDPYPMTHWDTCYRVHPDCADGRIEELRTELEKVQGQLARTQEWLDRFQGDFAEATLRIHVLECELSRALQESEGRGG